MSLTGQEISAADLVIKRHVAKCYPVSGSSYKANANRDITFRISSDDFADLSALTLFTKLQVPDYRLTLDDLHSSIIERVVVQLNGTVVEDISNVNDLHKVLTYAHCPKSYYQNEMHASQGAYKYCPSAEGDRGYHEDDFSLASDVETTDDAGVKRTSASNMFNHSDKDNQNHYISINLGTLLGVCRGYNGETRLWPLRYFTEMQITITIAQAHRALVAFCPMSEQVGTDAESRTMQPYKYAKSALTLNYELNNPFLLYTAVQLDTSYYEQFQKMLTTQGFTSFFDSYYSIAKQIVGKIDVHNIPLTISRSDIRAVYCVFRPQAFLSEGGVAFPNSNFFLGDCFKSATLSYGSEIIPACRIESSAEAHYHLQSTLNKHGSIISGSVLDYDEYTGVSRKKLRGVQYHPYPSEADGSLPAAVEHWNPMRYQPSCFILAFPLAKCYDSSATTGVGVDTLGSAAHMILSVDFTARSNHVKLAPQVADPATGAKTGGTTIGVSESLAANMNGWEMLVICDTSRVLRFSGGAVTASV